MLELANAKETFCGYEQPGWLTPILTTSLTLTLPLPLPLPLPLT